MSHTPFVKKPAQSVARTTLGSGDAIAGGMHPEDISQARAFSPVIFDRAAAGGRYGARHQAISGDSTRGRQASASATASAPAAEAMIQTSTAIEAWSALRHSTNDSPIAPAPRMRKVIAASR